MSRRFSRRCRFFPQMAIVTQPPFTFYTDITKNPLQLFSMKPGDHYKLFEYHIKFYDFTLVGHINNLKELIMVESCQSKISKSYFNNAAEQARFAIVIEFDATNSDEGSIYCDSLIIAANHSPGGPYRHRSKAPPPTELFIALCCSRNLFSLLKQKQLDLPLTYNLRYTFQTGFGIILQCVLLNYAHAIGFLHVYLNASETALLNYYTRFGFRLGTQCQEENEAITKEHELHIKNKTTQEWYSRLAPTSESEYAMKLCHFSLDPLRHYCATKLLDTCQTLAKYPDVYSVIS